MLLSLTIAGVLGASTGTPGVQPPSPFGSLPSPRQIAHAHLETYAFLHFSPNTFTDREWGNGDEDPNVFNPTRFDPDQIVAALKAAGMEGAILTCKHHDGFCLWPTKTTEHSIASSSWRGGHGDVVKEISDACKRHGLKFGVYLSPWDRNNAHYGKPEYVSIYREQLRELLTQYGSIFEVWHDGANGGSGYYGGARETRSIDRKTYYGWPQTWELVRKLQPGACIFSDIGPDLRWVGNESGYAADTSWSTYDPVGEQNDAPAPGYVKSELGETGTRGGRHWLPAECDVSIRPGWFWHSSEDSKVKSVDQLTELYFKSVGRGASFLLNVPPNREGRISDPDVETLKEFGHRIRATFEHNLVSGASLSASNTRGNDSRFRVENLISNDSKNYWATDDSVMTPTIEIQFRQVKTFDVIRLREAIQLGQRVEAFAVDVWKDGEWKEAAAATSVGSCRLIRLDEPVTTDRVRLRITRSPVCPALNGFGLFLLAKK
ncbi:MAG: alpha-L-fucosidase [Fimbriimonas sp.]|nr:alpha-L-fucosidase [Fimbriimonas sp.]